MEVDRFRHDLVGGLIRLSNRLHLSYWCIRGTGWLARALPLRVSYSIVLPIADLVFALWTGLRQRTTENMRWVLAEPEDERAAARLARKAFRNYFKYLVEFLRFSGRGAAEIERVSEIRGLEHLHGALAAGRGAIAVGFHLGNIDLGAALLASVGYPVHVVVDRFEPPKLNALIQSAREEKGLKLIPLELAPRQGIRALRRNEVLALLIDKPAPDGGVVVRFFGGKIAVPSGAAVLALRTGAAIVPCCVIRQSDGSFVGEIAAPVFPASLATGDTRQDVRTIMQRLFDTLERWVRRHPDQWYPFRRMWLSSTSRPEA